MLIKRSLGLEYIYATHLEESDLQFEFASLTPWVIKFSVTFDFLQLQYNRLNCLSIKRVYRISAKARI